MIPSAFIAAALISPALTLNPDRSDKIGTPVWVYFTDKGAADEPSLRRAAAALSGSYDPHAVQRRRNRRTRPGLFDESDLPLSRAYLSAVLSTGATLRVQSRWLNAASVMATPAQAAAIRALPGVCRVERVRAGRRSARPTPTALAAPGTDSFYGLAHDQLTQINLPALHGLGYTGAGVRIGILDTGFRRSHTAFNTPGHGVQVIAEHDFVSGDGNTAPEAGDDPDQHVHGTLILGCLAAYQPNDLVGGAFGASFILCKTEDITSETPIEEDHYVAGVEFIEQHGGDVATSSLAYIDWYSQSQLNGLTGPSTIAVNMATANGVFFCTAAGNAGHDQDPAIAHLGGVPADAFDVLTIGATDANGITAEFSSDGPTADGRLKPELLARGVNTATVWPWDDTGFAAANGTSLSTPIAACAVACLAQAHPTWTVAQMRAALFATGSGFVATGAPDPLNIRGYGLIDAAAAHSYCYANCDGSTAEPALNVQDFGCFLNAFASAAPYANCDGSTNTPTLNVQDFGCFLNRFASGCP